jgi:hypothetical protein
MEWIKKALSDINSVLKELGSTLQELAGSKRAIMGALAIAVPIAAQAFPQYAAQISQVLPYAEGVFAVLALLYTVRPTTPVSNPG